MPVWMLQWFPSQTVKPLIETLTVLQRFAFSPTAVPEKILEPLQDEPVQVTEALARIAEVKLVVMGCNGL